MKKKSWQLSQTYRQVDNHKTGLKNLQIIKESVTRLEVKSAICRRQKQARACNVLCYAQWGGFTSSL